MRDMKRTKRLAKLRVAGFFMGMVTFFVSQIVFAGMLGQMSDVISTSAPGQLASHTIQFIATNGVPASGKIIIIPESGFDVPASFNYTDVDLAVATSTGAPFIDRNLVGVATTTSDSVFVITGTSSSFMVTLSSTGAIGVGDIVQIQLGTNAKHGEMGDQMITNASTTGSFRVDGETRDSTNVIVDAWNTLVYLIEPVGVGPVSNIDDTPPVISNVLPPDGILLQAGTRNLQVSLDTNEAASCRYSDVAGTDYTLMINMFDQTLDLSHTVNLTTLTDDTSYSFYIRCADNQGNQSVEYQLDFAIGVVPLVPGTGGVVSGPPGEPGDGVGGGPFEYGGPYLGSARVQLEGRSYPGSSITVFRDGTLEKKISVASNGTFQTVVENLARGTYTFGIFAEDIEGRRSTTYTTTISINADTGNIISRIYLPPTIEVEDDTLDPGEELVVSGQAIAGSFIEVFLGKQAKLADKNTAIATSTASVGGNWEVVFDTANLELETYEVKARTTVDDEDPGDFSAVVYVGIGGEPLPDYSLRADLNKDGRVDIIDFSILLFNWATADIIADINLDGKVGLTDFSIMLFYWTG